MNELFTEIAQKVATRNGGYTRVIKLGQRFGDGAEVAIIELVDYTAEDRKEKTEKKTAVKAEKKPAKAKKEPKKKKEDTTASA